MTTKHDLERMGAGPAEFQRQRIEAIRTAVSIEGKRRNATESRISQACDEAERQFLRDPSSAHRAKSHGCDVLDQPDNVVPLRRS